MTLTTGQMKATELLTGLIASARQDVSGGNFVGAEGGISCELELETGDRFVVVVQWIGDREADA